MDYLLSCCAQRPRMVVVHGGGKPLEQQPKKRWHPEIKILSFNIFIRPDVFKEFQNERLELFTNYVLPQYDVVCLQELFHIPMTGRRSKFIEEAKLRGFVWHHHSVKKNSLSPTIDGGLLILSRLPMVVKDSVVFSSAAFADWYASKGAIYCLVQCGPSRNHYIHVFCTHLQATYDTETQSVSEKVRQDQLAELAVFIEKCTKNHSQGNNWPIVVCGDLNVQCRQSSTDGTDSIEYIDMMKTLKAGLGFKGEFLRDLVKEIDGLTHPVTYGDAIVNEDGSIESFAEKSLTDTKQHVQHTNQSLDKMFWVPATETKESAVFPLATVINPLSIDRENWKIPDIPGELPLSHLSDHYAVETTFQVTLP